jgi:hypothetical protein
VKLLDGLAHSPLVQKIGPAAWRLPAVALAKAGSPPG